MNRKFISIIIPAFICSISFTIARAQSKSLIKSEQDLATLHMRAEKNIPDSVEYDIAKFGALFLQVLKNNPESINYNFKKLQHSHVNIATSADKQFRVYSWDALSGGTMHYFDAIFQYRFGGKSYTFVPKMEEGDPGAWYSDIYNVNIEGKTYYLVVGNVIGSTKDLAQFVQAYCIDNGKLNDRVKLFKPKGKAINLIDVGFDPFKLTGHDERPFRLITYDSTTKTLFIPVVNDQDSVTGKRIVYRLKGKLFEFTGIR